MAKTPKKDQAKALYIKGISLSEIARRLKVDRSTVTRWKRLAKDTGDDWDKLRDSLPEDPKPKPVPLSLDDYRAGKGAAKAAAKALDVGDLSTIKGQLDLIDKLIGVAMTEAQAQSTPQTYASSIGAVPKLLSERRAIAPLDKTAYVLKLQEMFRSPEELLEFLKSTGWGRKSA